MHACILGIYSFFICDYLYINHIIGVLNGNPLQYSCLENSMDRGAE